MASAPLAPATVSHPTFQSARSGLSPTDSFVVRAHNVHKYYGKIHALDGVDLEVRRGEVVGFLGPNGAGKTTFTKILVGFLKPSQGTIQLFGQDVSDTSRETLARVGVVPDQYDFYGNLNGVQHLEFYGRLYGIPKAQLPTRVHEALTAVGAAEYANRRVKGYSHGMKQRLCIAQAILNRPEFIIFDEPTNGLDPRGAFEVRELIKNLRKTGVSIFLSSHILHEVEEVCTRVAILSRGRILVQSAVSDLRKRMRGGKVQVTFTLEAPSSALETVPVSRAGALSSKLQGSNLIVEVRDAKEISDVTAALVKAGARIRGVQEEQIGLEEIFLQMTKGEGGH